MVGAIGGWLRVTVRNLSLDGAMPEVCNPTFVMIVSGCSQSSSSVSEIATLGYRRLSVDCEWGLTIMWADTYLMVRLTTLRYRLWTAVHNQEGLAVSLSVIPSNRN